MPEDPYAAIASDPYAAIASGAPGKFTQLPGMPTLADAPGGPKSQPMSSVRTLTGTPYNPGRIEREIVDQVGGIGQQLANVSAPVILHRTAQRMGISPHSRIYEGEGTLKDAARDATMMIAPEGMEADSIAAASPRVASPTAPAGESGILGRAGEVALRRASHIPGVQAVKDADYILRGSEPTAPILKPKPAPAPIPETNGIQWGTGGQGPLDLRGQRIPAEPAPSILTPIESTAPAEAAKPAPQPTPKATLTNLEKQINDALGGKPLQRGAPIANRPLTNLQEQIRESAGTPAQTPKAPLGNLSKQIAAAAHPLPEGFTPVESSVVKGYKYDPESQQLTTITNSGQSYTHAEVTPEEFKTFEAAKSKGTAWNKQIRANHVQVEKNGQPTKPIAPRNGGPAEPILSPIESTPAPKAARAAKPAAASEDLTSQLQKSVEAANAANAKKAGVPTTVKPSALTKRWGVDESSIADTDANTRGMSAQQSKAYIDKLAKSYKEGKPVEPVIETRDANNNLTSVDGRHRALAAQKAGIGRIPIIVRRTGVQ